MAMLPDLPSQTERSIAHGIVRKPTYITHFKRDLGPTAQRLLATIVWVVQNTKPRKGRWYAVKKKLVKLIVGWRSAESFSGVRDAANEIFENSFDWNYYGADRTRVRGRKRFLIDIAEIERDSEVFEGRNDIFAFQLHPEIEAIISDPKVFGRINIVMMSMLGGSKHAFAMYELCVDTYSRGKPSMRISLEALRYFLALDDTVYKTWGDFNRRLLVPTINYVNERSDIKVTFDTYKDGRSVAGLVFHVEPKRPWQAPLDLELLHEMQLHLSLDSDELPPLQLDHVDAQSARAIESVEEVVDPETTLFLLDKGLPDKVVEKYQTVPYVDAVLDLEAADKWIEEQARRGRGVSNRNGAYVSALKERWGRGAKRGQGGAPASAHDVAERVTEASASVLTRKARVMLPMLDDQVSETLLKSYESWLEKKNRLVELRLFRDAGYAAPGQSDTFYRYAGMWLFRHGHLELTPKELDWPSDSQASRPSDEVVSKQLKMLRERS